MEVIEACSSLLSNKEVLELLRSNSKNIGKNTNLATILYEATSYLETSPAATTTLSGIAEFLASDSIKDKQLTKLEKIQIANLKPQNLTELHLIVDNIEDKFTEEQRVTLLETIEVTLNKPFDQVKKKTKFN